MRVFMEPAKAMEKSVNAVSLPEFTLGTGLDFTESYPKLNAFSIKIKASGFNEVLGYKANDADVKKLAY